MLGIECDDHQVRVDTVTVASELERAGKLVEAGGLVTLAELAGAVPTSANLLHYCRIVHSHHHLESAMLFPALRRANPALNPVVDKLEADHVHVSGLLDEVEGVASDLDDAENPQTRQRLVEALETLSVDLLAHLQYEEEQISPTLRTWTRWPGW